LEYEVGVCVNRAEAFRNAVQPTSVERASALIQVDSVEHLLRQGETAFLVISPSPTPAIGPWEVSQRRFGVWSLEFWTLRNPMAIGRDAAFGRASEEHQDIHASIL